MREHELDELISKSLKAFGSPEPPKQSPHQFSARFEQQMRPVIGYSPPRRHFRLRKIWYALIAALLAVFATSMTAAVATKTHRVNTFADGIGYQALGGEALLENPELSYDLTPLYERFSQGVEIHCGEQLTRFFRDADGKEFVEFSSYPKIAFRYHISLPDTDPEPLKLGKKNALWFSDHNEISYLLWDTPSSVVVLRSNLPKEELCSMAERIEVYENAPATHSVNQS
ncbi:MAG: hypothetical protein II916_06845 [Oscillospiraceae bacterium]|nr:hypothetical protein [Oscillospiraceae bacterium]